jgi:hypothetical protein
MSMSAYYNIGQGSDAESTLLLAHSGGSHSAWRTAVALPAAVRNSHRNGGSVFLIFVADPRTTRLCTNRIQEPGSPTQDPLPTPVPRVR